MEIKYREDGPRSCFVVAQMKPAIRTVSHLSSNKKLRISFPYCVFPIGIARDDDSKWFALSLQFFGSKKPLTSLDDPLIRFEMPPLSIPDCFVCGLGRYSSKTIEEVIEKTICSFWNTHFSYLWPTGDYIKGLKILEKWQKMTQGDPLFWQEHDFPALMSLKNFQYKFYPFTNPHQGANFKMKEEFFIE